MKVLLDQGMNPRLYGYLEDHEVVHANHIGWDRLNDGLLVRAAQEAGFDVLITSDKKMFEEQKHIIQRISLVVLSGTKTRLIRAAHQRIKTAVENSIPKGHVYIDLLENL